MSNIEDFKAFKTPLERMKDFLDAKPKKSTNNGIVDFSGVKGSSSYTGEMPVVTTDSAGNIQYKYSSTKTEVTETVSAPVKGSLDTVKGTTPKAPLFSTTSLQQDGVNMSLKRMEFSFLGQSYKFKLNPEEYTQDEPNLINAVHTKGGAYVDDFGGGIFRVVMKGTTGWRESGPTTGKSGFQRFKALRDLIRKYYFNVEPGSSLTDDKEMIWYNYTDGEYWVVVPTTFNLMRSISRPLLYSYHIEMILLRPAYSPSNKGGSSNLGTLEAVEVITK